MKLRIDLDRSNMCRKIAELEEGRSIENWGDGTAIRSYAYVDDMVEGIFTLMHSDLDGPVNIGSPEYNTVNELLFTAAKVVGKEFGVKHVDGPVGVQARNFSNERTYTTGWRARYSLEDGIAETYNWIAAQVKAQVPAATTLS